MKETLFVPFLFLLIDNYFAKVVYVFLFDKKTGSFFLKCTKLEQIYPCSLNYLRES
jgi:hypothetical protein